MHVVKGHHEMGVVEGGGNWSRGVVVSLNSCGRVSDDDSTLIVSISVNASSLSSCIRHGLRIS